MEQKHKYYRVEVIHPLGPVLGYRVECIAREASLGKPNACNGGRVEEITEDEFIADMDRKARIHKKMLNICSDLAIEEHIMYPNL